MFYVVALNLLPSDDIERLADATKAFIVTDYPLGQVEHALVQLVGALSGMQPDVLFFVSRLNAHGGLLEFLATFESMAAFDTQASVVRSLW